MAEGGGGIAAAVAAATAGAIAKVAAAEQAAAAEAATKVQDVTAMAKAADRKADAADGVRFFLRGVGKLQEHHLKDYFQRMADIVELQIVRDKKTQRPRGMAFITLAPRKGGGEECPATEDALTERLTAEAHTINDSEVEVQEALPNPKDESAEADGQAAAPAEAATAEPAAATRAEEPAAPALDPAAQAHAQAQWQMHYLAMAINASVPEVGNLMPKAAPARPPARKPAPAAGAATRGAPNPGAVPKGAPHAGAVPKGGSYAAAPPHRPTAKAGSPY